MIQNGHTICRLNVMNLNKLPYLYMYLYKSRNVNIKMRTNSVCIVCLITTDDKIYFDIQNTG